MLLKMMKKTQHWNPKPKPDFIISLFKQFFASEPYQVAIFTGLLLALLFYFMSLHKKESTVADGGISPVDSLSLKLNLTLPVLFSWVFFTLFIPYFRSLAMVPMYVSKYGIGVLPAVIVMIAISIALFKNNTFKAILISSILLFALTNLFRHQQFYTKTWKTNWRECAVYVLETNDEAFPDKEMYILTKQPTFYQFYFHSLQPKRKKIESLPLKLPKLKSILKNMLKKNKDIGVWLLPGFKFKPAKDERMMAFLNRHFNRAETRKVSMGRATLYVPKKGQEPRNPDRK